MRGFSQTKAASASGVKLPDLLFRISRDSYNFFGNVSDLKRSIFFKSSKNPGLGGWDKRG